MATRTSVGSGNWSDAGTWDTKPAAGDDVVIADGHAVALNENIDVATITNAGNTGYITCSTSVTVALSGAGITYSGTLTDGFIRLTANTLTVTGSATSTGTMTITGSGKLLVVSNSAAYVITAYGTNRALYATTNSGVIINSTTTGASTITGIVENASGGLMVTHATGAGTITINGAVIASAAQAVVSMANGTVTINGKITCALTMMRGNGAVLVGSSGTCVWIGTHEYTAGEYGRITSGASTTSTITLGTSGTGLVIDNAGAAINIVSTGAVGTQYCTHTRTLPSSHFSLVHTGTWYSDIGPVIPAEGDVQETVEYGYEDDLQTGTFTAPSEDDVQDSVTYGGGGTEYEGNFVVPLEADVWAGTGGYGAGGTEFTPAMHASDITVTGGDAATLTAPDILDGIIVDDVTGSATGGTGPSAADIVDAWATASQADPTRFHVNVMEVNSEAATPATAPPTAAEILATQMTESYNADGTAPTLAQALFVIMQRLTEFDIDGDTITVKKLNATDDAYTLTMDSATTPTSSTRAT